MQCSFELIQVMRLWKFAVWQSTVETDLFITVNCLYTFKVVSQLTDIQISSMTFYVLIYGCFDIRMLQYPEESPVIEAKIWISKHKSLVIQTNYKIRTKSPVFKAFTNALISRFWMSEYSVCLGIRTQQNSRASPCHENVIWANLWFQPSIFPKVELFFLIRKKQAYFTLYLDCIHSDAFIDIM